MAQCTDSDLITLEMKRMYILGREISPNLRSNQEFYEEILVAGPVRLCIKIYRCFSPATVFPVYLW